MHRVFLLCSTIFAAMPVGAQGNKPALEFEVVSIRVAPELSIEEYAQDRPNLRVSISLGLVRMPYETMHRIALRAFGVPEAQLSGPEWMKSRHYTIEGKMPAGTAPGDVPETLRTMLSTRFGMTYHREVRSTAALVLTPAKGGLKAKTVTGESRLLVRAARDGGLHFQVATTPAGFADFLKQYTHAPVIDRTGLDGIYQFVLDYYPFGRLGEGRVPLDPPIGTFTDNLARRFAEALAPLGLRLDPSKVPLDNVVIDQVERVPTEN